MYAVEVTFGHTRRNSEQLPTSCIVQAEEQILTLFAQCFGGGHRLHALGSYRTNDHQLVIEMCTITRAYTYEIQAHWDKLHALARDIACLLDQDCVLLTIFQLDGSLDLIEPA